MLSHHKNGSWICPKPKGSAGIKAHLLNCIFERIIQDFLDI